MKKNLLISLLAISMISGLFCSTFMPTLSLRYNDLTNPANSSLETLDQDFVLGFKVNVGEGVDAGFDSSNGDSRIFVAFDYGTVGMGMNSAGDPQFTIGGSYAAFTNLDISLDYVINNLINRTLDDEGAEVAGEIPNELRLTLGVSF